MNLLAQKILRQELRVEFKKKLTCEQYNQLKTNFHKKIASPMSLGIAFCIGFMGTYRKSQNNKTRISKFPFWIGILQVVNKTLSIIEKIVR